MAEYSVAVLLAALVCLVTISTCQSAKEPCWPLAKLLTGLETKEGDALQGRMVQCTLMGLENELVKFTFDIGWALNASADINNNTLVLVSVVFWCLSPIELDFINPRNIVNKNILYGLSLKGECKVSAQNLVIFAQVTDLRILSVAGKKATWLTASGSSFTNLTQLNDSLGNDLKELAFIKAYNSLPENIPAMFFETKNVWPNMAEIDFRRMPMERIPEQWKTTMPQLQRLFMIECNLTKPPDFPWNNSTLELVRSLRRTDDSTTVLHWTHVKRNHYVRVLYLDYNNINDLTSHEFSGFLHMLSLRGNGLKAVGPSCFRYLKGIQTIDLSKNNLASLPQNLFQGLNSLLNVILGSNKLIIIEEKLFEGLKNIKIISLDRNNLHFIPNGLFCSLDSLEILNLGYNNITKIEENPFPKNSSLLVLYLDNNKLSSIPSWIFHLQKIRLIDLSSNLLTFEDLDKALDKFTMPLEDTTKQTIELDLSNNNITTLVDSEGLKMIKRDAKIFPVRQAKYSYLWGAYLIKLSGNPLACDCIMSAVAHEIKKLLEMRPYIRSRFETWKCHWPHELKNKSILEIEENQWMLKEEQGNSNCPVECTCRERCSDRRIVVDCERRRLTDVPSVMPQGVIELNLIGNDIQSIPAYPYLVNVTVLKLTNNKIKALKASRVTKLKHVEIFLIDANKLTTLPREIESLNFTMLALDGNLFKCDCTTKWMKQWLVKKRRRIKNIDRVLCNSENDIGQPIYSLPDDQFICPPVMENNPQDTTHLATIAASTLGTLLALVMIVSLLLYKYHGEVKVFMFTHFNWHPLDRIDDSNPNKIYDAFISYSGSDFDWVENTLQQRLEKHDPPYKLCFHHRDFIAGLPVVENIWKSLDQSKRMVVVLSSSYAKSDWCLMEFRAAHRKVIEDRMKYLIVILFDDVDTTEVDDEIKLYLRTNTYLSVSNKWFWQNLFYAMPLPTKREPVRDRNQENFEVIVEEAEREMAYNVGDTIELVEQ